jgi:hypothetical protein
VAVLGPSRLKFSVYAAKKTYYLAATASLGLIAWAILHWGETNLPPLMPAVRYFILALFANWFLAYALLISDPKVSSESPRSWIGVGIIGFFLSFMWPVFSGDLMEYLIRGRMLGLYHVSPYRAIPNDFPNDILRPFSIWITNPDSYGPLSVYIQTIPAMLFPKSITGMIWGYKIIILAFLYTAIYFFWKIVRDLRWVDGPRLWATFAYCPLLLMTAFVDGHNDIIMMTFSVMSVYFLIRQKYSWSFFFWTCGFLVKYMIIFQLPFMVLIAVRMKWSKEHSFPWKFILKMMLMSVLWSVVCFAPVWGGMDTFLAILRQKGAFYTNTVPYLFYLALTWLKLPANQQVIKFLFLGAFGSFYVYLLARSWQRRSDDYAYFFKASALAYLAFYAALPSPMGYWYLSWAVFLIILAKWPQGFVLVLIYSAVGVTAFFKRINFLLALGTICYCLALAQSYFQSRRSLK